MIHTSHYKTWATLVSELGGGRERKTCMTNSIEHDFDEDNGKRGVVNQVYSRIHAC